MVTNTLPEPTAPGTSDSLGEQFVEIHRTRSGVPYAFPRLPGKSRRLYGESADAYAAFQGSVMARLAADRDMELYVVVLRAQGVSWALIGWACGMTGEGARKRWGETVDRDLS